jgi:hypothetical protein
MKMGTKVAVRATEVAAKRISVVRDLKNSTGTSLRSTVVKRTCICWIARRANRTPEQMNRAMMRAVPQAQVMPSTIWSWFKDERADVDRSAHNVYLSSAVHKLGALARIDFRNEEEINRCTGCADQEVDIKRPSLSNRALRKTTSDDGAEDHA